MHTLTDFIASPIFISILLLLFFLYTWKEKTLLTAIGLTAFLGAALYGIFSILSGALR
ncbi:MAG: hypothetical protein LBT70_02130 [Holosporaceae bacterium]|nr:hypothetical protein [Holosporaceae bacterium]